MKNKTKQKQLQQNSFFAKIYGNNNTHILTGTENKQPNEKNNNHNDNNFLWTKY